MLEISFPQTIRSSKFSLAFGVCLMGGVGTVASVGFKLERTCACIIVEGSKLLLPLMGGFCLFVCLFLDFCGKPVC